MRRRARARTVVFLAIPAFSIAWTSATAHPDAALGHRSSGGLPLLFAEPERACQVLEDQGLATFGWQKSLSSAGEWACFSAPMPFGERPSTGFITYAVRGDTPAIARDIRVRITVREPSAKSEALRRLQTVLTALFQAAGETLPDSIVAAVESGRNGGAKTGFGRVMVVRGSADHTEVILRVHLHEPLEGS